MRNKICTECGRKLPATTIYFVKNIDGEYGLKNECKECSKERIRIWKEKHPDENLSTKEYYDSHKEYYSEKAKIWADKNRDYVNRYHREYYKNKIFTEEERKKISIYQKEYYETNKEEIAAKKREYYIKKKELKRQAEESEKVSDK